jgi:acyl-coenzyme A thioesterase PaaI-like protein
MRTGHFPEGHSNDEAIRARVLRAIAANRTPGLHFIGHFLDLEWQNASPGTARAVLQEGPYCRTATQTVDPAVLGALIDHTLATAVRTGTGMTAGSRIGTINLEAQFTGVPVAGDLTADTRLLGCSDGTALRQSLAVGTIRAGNQAACHISGAYAPLDAPPGVTLSPLPWERAEAPPIIPVAAGEFLPKELAILEACEASLRKASPQASFIQRFWGGLPRRTARGASSRYPISPQIANRVGHVQGGILFGLAAANACAAAPPAMILWNLSVCYIVPGRGSALVVRSRLLHAGRTLAVVRTEIMNADGGRVLEAISNHVAQKQG